MLSRNAFARSMYSVRRSQHRRQAAAGFARADHVHVEAREDAALRVEGLRQRRAAAHLVADLREQVGDLRRAARLMRISKLRSSGRPRLEERRQLARDDADVVLLMPRRVKRGDPPAGVATFAAPASIARMGINPISWRRPTAAGVLEASSTPSWTSPRSHRLVLKNGMRLRTGQSSRVTRRTSSMVVIPARDLRSPFSNIVSMPAATAAARSSPAVA